MKKFLIFIGLIVLFFLFYFSTKIEIPFLFCPINKFFNIYCPGCGVTRMIVSIIELDFYQAFRYNNLIFVLSPFFFLCGLDEILILFGRKSFFINKISNKFWIIILVLVILYGILRNIPFFEYLIPTAV